MKKLIKTLFPIFTLMLIPVYFYLGIALYLFQIVNYYSGIREVIYNIACIIGGLTAPLGILGIILGFFFRKKGWKKAGVIVPLLGLMVGGTILAGFLVDELVGSIQRRSEDKQWYEETYGVDWDAPSKIDGIPKNYEKILNQVYVSVRDEWGEEKLTDSRIFSTLQPLYYEGNSLENLGFAVMDLNGDGGKELIIGPIRDVEGYENIFFRVYTEKINPHRLYGSDESMLHYFHKAEDGTYYVERYRLLDDGTPETTVYKITQGLRGYDGRYDIEVEMEVDPADRTKIELIPFAEYK